MPRQPAPPQLPPVGISFISRDLIIKAEAGRAAEVADRVEDRGGQVLWELSNVDVVIARPSPELQPDTAREVDGVKQVDPDVSLPVNGATPQQTIPSRKELLERVDFARRPLGVRDIQIRSRVNRPAGAGRTDLPAILQEVNAAAARDRHNRGEDATIVVIDTGVSKAVIPPRRRAGGMAPGQGDPFVDTVGHGSMVAAIAAGDRNHFGVDGVAPEADIISIRLRQGPRGGLYMKDVIIGADFLLGIQDEVPDMVMNHSWGDIACEKGQLPFVSCSAIISEVGHIMPQDQGIPQVFACGNLANVCNNPRGNTIWCGPSIPGMMDAAALTEDLRKQPYSSAGPGQCGGQSPSVAVPTYGVLPWGNGFADFGPNGGGTSACAPVVSGTYALMRTASPRESPLGLKQIVESTATNAPVQGLPERLRGQNWNPLTGNGLLDAEAAVEAVSGLSSPTSRTFARRL